MFAQIGFASSAVCEAPVPTVDPNDAFLFVNDGIDSKGWINEFRYPFTLFMNRIAIQYTCTDTCLTSTNVKIECQHMGCFNGPSGGQPGTNRFAAACEAGKVVKVDSSDENDFGKLCECFVDLDRNTTFRDALMTQRLGIVGIMSEHANTLNYER